MFKVWDKVRIINPLGVPSSRYAGKEGFITSIYPTYGGAGKPAYRIKGLPYYWLEKELELVDESVVAKNTSTETENTSTVAENATIDYQQKYESADKAYQDLLKSFKEQEERIKELNEYIQRLEDVISKITNDNCRLTRQVKTAKAILKILWEDAEVAENG